MLLIIRLIGIQIKLITFFFRVIRAFIRVNRAEHSTSVRALYVVCMSFLKDLLYCRSWCVLSHITADSVCTHAVTECVTEWVSERKTASSNFKFTGKKFYSKMEKIQNISTRIYFSFEFGVFMRMFFLFFYLYVHRNETYQQAEKMQRIV